MNLHQLIPDRRITDIVNIVGGIVRPVVNQRLKPETVATTVPEHFQHFDFVRIIGADRCRQFLIVGAGDIQRRLRPYRECQCAQQRHGAQFYCLLDHVATPRWFLCRLVDRKTAE